MNKFSGKKKTSRGRSKDPNHDESQIYRISELADNLLKLNSVQADLLKHLKKAINNTNRKS